MTVLLLLLTCCCAVSVLAGPAPHYDPEDAAQHFEDFIIKFNKQYASEEEKAARFEIFKANLEDINKLNENNQHTIFGITKFIDLTEEEFLHMYTGLWTPEQTPGDSLCNVVSDESISDAGAPDSFDWRSKNAVTPVKDQSHCGSCYAFSAIAQVESQYAIKHGQIVDLSEHEIVDCCTRTGGCNGGLPELVFESLMDELGGVMSEADYPYIAKGSAHCSSDPNKAVVQVSGCSTYSTKSQEKLKQVLFKSGPLSIAFQGMSLHKYHSGVLRDADCVGPLTHAVLLVGYGTDPNTNISYWILKNSWGPTWGENGFFKLQRSENPDGACGMMNDHISSSVIA